MKPSAGKHSSFGFKLKEKMTSIFHRDDNEHVHENEVEKTNEGDLSYHEGEITDSNQEQQNKHESNKSSKHTTVSISTMPATGKTVQRLDALSRMKSKDSENQRYSVDAKVTVENGTSSKLKPSSNSVDQKRHSFVPDLNQLEQERKDRIVREKALRRKNLDDKMQDLSIEEEVTKKKRQ